MEETNVYWNLPDDEYNYTQRLQELCTQFNIQKTVLRELLSTPGIVLAGGAALWCTGLVSGAVQSARNQTSSVGDISND